MRHSGGGYGHSGYGRVSGWRPGLSWVMIILVICVLMFVWLLASPDTILPLLMWPDNPMPWMFVTSIFIHASVDHIFWNMFMLVMFGTVLERLIGGHRFVLLFILAGVVGNMGYVAYCLVMGIATPAVGASGALYGLFACLAVLRPDMKVYLFFALPVRIVYVLAFYAAFDILFMNSGDRIAHAAHLAGLAAGLAYGWYIRRSLAPREPAPVRYSYGYDYY